MRNFKETFPRLLIIYEHFAEGKLYDDYSWYTDMFSQSDLPVMVISKRRRAYFDAYPFVFGELTYLFREWQKWPYGNIKYTIRPRLDEDEGLTHFLGLSKQEFAHLFIPNMQSADYGGEELDMIATPQEVAINIKIFLERELDKQSKAR